MTNGDAWQAVNENFGDLFRRVNELEARATPSPTAEVISLFMSLPGLRGFWPMSSIDYAAANRAVDVSGQANHMTANNVPLFGYDGLAPYVEFDGVDQYLSKADGGAANWADIIGTESYIDSSQRGLTFGCWINVNKAATGTEYVIAKWDGDANQKSYSLIRNAAGFEDLYFRVSDLGTPASLTVIPGPFELSSAKWHFVTCRFVPSTSIAIFLDNQVAINTLAIPATLFDSTSSFTMGAETSPLNFFAGRLSMSYLCAAALSDDIISQLYQQSRGLFRV